jgi:hypothetical protein
LSTLPDKETTGLFLHSVWSGPAVASGPGTILIRILSFTGKQLLPIDEVVRARVTPPANISEAEAVYWVLNESALGLNVPVPFDQDPPIPPDMVPLRVATGKLVQTSMIAGPAFTVGGSVKVMVKESFNPIQVTVFTLKYSFTEPAISSEGLGV